MGSRHIEERRLKLDEYMRELVDDVLMGCRSWEPLTVSVSAGGGGGGGGGGVGGSSSSSSISSNSGSGVQKNRRQSLVYDFLQVAQQRKLVEREQQAQQAAEFEATKREQLSGPDRSSISRGLNDLETAVTV